MNFTILYINNTLAKLFLKSAVLIIFCFSCEIVCSSYESRLNHISNNHALSMYQLMKDVDEVFNAAGVTYWAIAGTLLGAFRNNGIIPWDDDLDIAISDFDTTKLKNLKAIFEQLQYSLEQKGQRPVWVIKNKVSNVHLDIVISYNYQNKILYSCPLLQKIMPHRDGFPLYIAEDELFPLKRYAFGALTILGPLNPIPYLQTAYGKNCLTHGAPHSYPPTTNHEFLLSDNDKQPAKPFGPLQDRTSQFIGKIRPLLNS